MAPTSGRSTTTRLRCTRRRLRSGSRGRSAGHGTRCSGLKACFFASMKLFDDGFVRDVLAHRSFPGSGSVSMKSVTAHGSPITGTERATEAGVGGDGTCGSTGDACSAPARRCVERARAMIQARDMRRQSREAAPGHLDQLVTTAARCTHLHAYCVRTRVRNNRLRPHLNATACPHETPMSAPCLTGAQRQGAQPRTT